MDSYIEWTGPKKDKQPHKLFRSDGQPLAALGFYRHGAVTGKREFIILTTDPSGVPGEIHTRMPLFANRETALKWITPEPKTETEIRKLRAAAIKDSAEIARQIIEQPISKRINPSAVDGTDKTLLDPVELEETLF